jgi:hypothetical protein
MRNGYFCMVFSVLLRNTFTRHGKVSKLTLLIWLDVNGQ